MKRLDRSSRAARDLEAGRYVIRTMTAADMAAIAIPWMIEAGWDPGLHDAETFVTADPAGFHIGLLRGEPIAIVSGVRYDDSFAFLGCYIVDAAHRGHGYGLAIHEAARDRLEGCVQGGDGVLENVSSYERIGRVLAYRNARFEGIRQAARMRFDPTVDAASLPIELIEALDRTCFPAPRRAFLEAWLRQPDAFARALPGSDGLRGFGVIRRCVRGWKVGPLFADDVATAEIILDALLDRIGVGDPWLLDVPEPNTAAMGLVGRRHLDQVFATARMYTGPAPSVALERVFGVTTFELG
jgi:RimJ/RimL family protein N-acetyltransferase